MTARSLLALVGATAAVQATSDIPTVMFPLYLPDGVNTGVSTKVVLPYAEIEMVYDLGSSNTIMFQNGSTMNWGCQYLLCQGPCNATVPANISYNPDLSLTKSDEGPWDGVYTYGGGASKQYKSDLILNDTFTFSNGLDTVVVPDVKVALLQYLQQRIGDSGSCSPVPNDYSQAIMGISIFFNSSVPSPNNAEGPCIRQDLLNQGRISAPVQSLWFDKAPSDGPFIGTGLLGGIDTSKYTGPLVRVPNTHGPYDPDKYMTYAANMTFYPGGGKPGVFLPNNYNITTTGANMSACMIDSGSQSEVFTPLDTNFWSNATGIIRSPDRPDNGNDLVFPGPCSSIPEDAAFEYDFITTREDEELKIRIPLRNYHRYQDPNDEARGWCTMAIYFGGCTYARTFNTGAFFAADDEREEFALAQGGVSEVGSGVNYDTVVLRIP